MDEDEAKDEAEGVCLKEGMGLEEVSTMGMDSFDHNIICLHQTLEV